MSLDSAVVGHELIPRFDQYMGLWSILEGPFRILAGDANRINLAEHLHEAGTVEARHRRSAAVQGQKRDLGGGVAVIDLHGVLTKTGDSLSAGGSTVAARRQVRVAAASDDVSAIVLNIDSPGGTVAGIRELGRDVSEASKKKTVVAYIDDMGASAAFWVASQAQHVFANETALVGGIGIFGAIEDTSEQAAKLGIKVHMISSGDFKGVGTPGTEVTPAHIAEHQRIVDSLNHFFVRDVSKGRGLTLAAVKNLNDGRVHLAKEALALGLIDGIRGFDDLISAIRAGTLQGRTVAQNNEEVIAMGDPLAEIIAQTPAVISPPSGWTAGTTTQPVAPAAAGALQAEVIAPVSAAATLLELQGALAGADSDFVLAQLTKGSTVEQASAEWMTKQGEVIAEQKKKLDAKANAEAQAPAGGGLEAVGDGGSGESSFDGDPVTEFKSRVQEKVSGGMQRSRAVSAVVSADPELHSAYLQACNPAQAAR